MNSISKSLSIASFPENRISEIEKVSNFLAENKVLEALDRLPLIDDEEERLQARELVLLAWLKMDSEDSNYQTIGNFLENDILYIQPDEDQKRLFESSKKSDDSS